jgi:hypothetical protein
MPHLWFAVPREEESYSTRSSADLGLPGIVTAISRPSGEIAKAG